MSAIAKFRPAGLPADINRLATRQEMREALALLSATLQHRNGVDPAVMTAAYEIALQGVCAVDLNAAVVGILQGDTLFKSLSDEFMPSAPELRGQCDVRAWWRSDSPRNLAEAARQEEQAKQIEDQRRRVEDAAKPIALLYHPEYQRKREERLARYSGRAPQ